MLTNEMIEANKNTFINLVNKIERENFKKDALIDKLLNSDFFYAPASTKYHSAYRGGLCEHCLQVYDNLATLVHAKNLDYDEQTLILVALFHDFAKMNTYEETSMNKKVYSPTGSKYDELGKFDWVAVKTYKTKDMEDRFIYGNHEETSEFMLRQFIPLSMEESMSIMYHHGGMGFDSVPVAQVGIVYSKYKLSALLHIADLMASYIDETRV